MRRTLLVLALLVLPPSPWRRRPPPRSSRGRRAPAFYTPPKQLKGAHGALVWARKHTGRDALKGAGAQRAAALPLDRRRRHEERRLGLARAAQGQAPEGRLAADHLRARDHRRGRRLRTEPRLRRRRARQLRLPAAPALAEGRLRRGADRLRGARHARRAPLPARRRPRAAACSTRPAPPARTHRSKLSKRVIVAGHSQGGHAALFAASLAPSWTPDLRVRGTVAFAPASHLATQFQATLGIATPGGGLGAIVGLGLRAVDLADPALGVAGPAHAAGRAAVPADRHGLLRRALRSRPRSAGCRSTRSCARTPTSPRCSPPSARATRSTWRSETPGADRAGRRRRDGLQGVHRPARRRLPGGRRPT